MRYLIQILFISLFLSGCVDNVNLDFNRIVIKLVVDGTITNGNGPYYINLSYSSQYTYARDTTDSKARIASGAQVTVTDDLGNIFVFKENSPGLYVSDSAKLIGTVARSYVLHISTMDGKAYRSNVEKLNPVASIDSLYYQIVDGEDDLYLDTHDPPNPGNYYQWRIIFGTRSNDWINIAPDDYFNGNFLKGYLLDRDDYHSGESIEVDQLSITKAKYNFLYTLNQQITNGGTPFDAPPAPIIGNVFNAGDSTDYALGYFGASAISSKSLIIK